MGSFDIRGLLQYVPEFRGRLFWVQFDGKLVQTGRWLNAVLDLLALQRIDVQLAIAVESGLREDLLRYLVRSDMRVARAGGAGEPSVAEVLRRGQAALVACDDELLGTSLLQHKGELSVAKIMVLSAERLRLHSSASRALRAGAIDDSLFDKEGALGALLQRAESWCWQGIRRVHLLEGGRRGVVLRELFSNEGVGLMVYSDAYRQIEPLREEEISELLALIGRSMSDACLLDRSYEEICERIDDYRILKVDGNLVGSVALHQFPQEAMMELACLYIKEDHEGQGYGRKLVAEALQRAENLGAKGVFALTRSAADYFQQRLGFERWERSQLPVARQMSLDASGRDSQVFGKML